MKWNSLVRRIITCAVAAATIATASPAYVFAEDEAEIVAIEDENVQYETALTVFDEELSVRETEQLVKGVINILNGKEIDDKGQAITKKKDDEAMLAIVSQLAEQLKDTLGSKVIIKKKEKKGKIEIEYVSSDDLERIIHIINTGVKQ